MPKEYYKFTNEDSEKELKWFFDHILEAPQANESYLMCISSRAKKVSKEERERIQLGRGEMMRENIITSRGKERLWNFEQFLSYIYRYECPVQGMVTKTGDPYPQNSLVLYIYVNPSDEHKVLADSMKTSFDIIADLINSATNSSSDGIKEQLFKLRTIDKHKKTCRAVNVSRHLWTQFDFDFSDTVKLNADLQNDVYNQLVVVGRALFGKGNVVVIRTSGGFHILVHREGMKHWNAEIRPKKQWNDIYKFKDPISDFIGIVNWELNNISTKGFTQVPTFKWFDEWTKTGQSFLPCPGTLQYGQFFVNIVNKGDFDEEQIQ